MKHPARAIVGAAVSFVILIFYVGGVPDAAMFMVFSIVCTAGVSLVVWIPVWYLLGWFVLGICGMAVARPESKKPTRPRTRQDEKGVVGYMRSMDVKGVVEYMRSAEASGLSKEQITRKLEEAGWSIAVIDEARRRLTHRNLDSQPHTP